MPFSEPLQKLKEAQTIEEQMAGGRRLKDAAEASNFACSGSAVENTFCLSLGVLS